MSEKTCENNPDHEFYCGECSTCHTCVEESRDSDSDKITAMQKQIDELNVTAKRAFWWSAEFTSISHHNKIADAWEDFLTHPHAQPLKGAQS